MKIIARIKNDYKTKFGVPRQSGLNASVISQIIFEKEYRIKEAFVGLEGFSHLWILWDFSQCDKGGFSPTVRPPVLGGNKRVGVFATRSPNRPNNIGLSVVKIEKISYDREDSPVIYVSGADMMNDTPIYDIKPYIAYADSIPDAKGGFTDDSDKTLIDVIFEQGIEDTICVSDANKIRQVLALDPCPRYIDDSDRIFGMEFADYEIKFKKDKDKIIVISVNNI